MAERIKLMENRIIAGDNLIIRHKEQKFEGVAGQPFHRNFSNVVQVEVRKIS